MDRIVKILIYLYLCAGVQCANQMSWLPCQFIDEHVFLNKENHTETERIHRKAMLQFGQKGDTPVNPSAITFLVTGSKLDLRQYVEGLEPKQLECELRRYSTPGIHVRWPVKGSKEYNRWFSCTLKDTKGLFKLQGLLRHPTDQPPTGQHDYRNWSVIPDKEILITTVVMVIKTQSPSVTSVLGAKQKLHCQFVLDHKVPNITVEWHWQPRGKRTRLFSHNSRLGQIKGTGVELKSLADGDASYTLSNAQISSEGMYVCSVSVNPLFASLDINLRIEEAPSISLNVESTLLLFEGMMERVVCRADNYYPLDVSITWYKQHRPVPGRGAPVSEKLKNVLHLSHIRNPNQTYSLSSFVNLQPSLNESGSKFTCIVSHQSLTVPIKKSFILTVEDPTGWTFMCILISVAILYFVILFWRRPARKKITAEESILSSLEQTKWKHQ